MTTPRRSPPAAASLAMLLLVVATLAAACGTPPEAPRAESERPTTSLAGSDEPPVALNANSPVEYPAALQRERIEGIVLVRLFVDERGAVVADSTRVAESSGYPALDTAALRGAAALRFSPALRRGTPVATAFLQPIHFRTPASAAAP